MSKGKQTIADEKKERFAVLFFDTLDAKRAALDVGVTNGPGLSVTVSRLLKDAKVRAKLAELKADLKSRIVITKERLIDEWARIAFADPGDVMSWTESGIDMIPSEKLGPIKRRLIKSLSHHTTATGESFKVEMVDRDSAKKELAKLLGFYPEEGTGEAVKLVFQFGGGKVGKDNS